ncbi:MAG: PAS domain S-box protein [Promethearchaeota archaeon]
MQSYQKEFVRIKEVLKTKQKGMTITDLSRALNINRNSVAKYLELLRLSGHVEMRSFGPAKVFFISHRVPLSAMLNFSSDYILVLDRDLRIVQVNDNLLDFMNIKKEDLLDHRIEDVSLPVFSRPEILSNLKEALDGKDSSMEISLPIDQAEFYFKIKLIPTTFDNGELGVTTILENVTEQKKIEKTLRASEERYRLLAENLIDVIWTMDLNLRYTYISPSVERLRGYSTEEAMALTLKENLTPTSYEVAKKHLEEELSKESEKEKDPHRSKTLELELYCKDGSTIWVEAKMTFLRDSDDRPVGILGVSRDITENKRVKEQLEEALKRERIALDISIIQRIIILLENAHSIESMLDITVNELVKVLQSEIGIIAKFDKDSQLEIMKQIGLNDEDMDRKLSFKKKHVAEDARIYNVDEMSKTVLQRLLPHYSVFSSIVCPINSSIFNGLFVLGRLYPEKFTERDLRIVSVVVASLENKLRQDSQESRPE